MVIPWSCHEGHVSRHQSVKGIESWHYPLVKTGILPVRFCRSCKTIIGHPCSGCFKHSAMCHPSLTGCMTMHWEMGLQVCHAIVYHHFIVDVFEVLFIGMTRSPLSRAFKQQVWAHKGLSWDARDQSSTLTFPSSIQWWIICWCWYHLMVLVWMRSSLRLTWWGAVVCDAWKCAIAHLCAWDWKLVPSPMGAFRIAFPFD